MILVRNQSRDMLGGETGKITFGKWRINLRLRAKRFPSWYNIGTLGRCGLQGCYCWVCDGFCHALEYWYVFRRNRKMIRDTVNLIISFCPQGTTLFRPNEFSWHFWLGIFTKYRQHMCRLSWNLGASTSWNPLGLSRPVMGLLYLYHQHIPTLINIVRK